MLDAEYIDSPRNNCLWYCYRGKWREARRGRKGCQGWIWSRRLMALVMVMVSVVHVDSSTVVGRPRRQPSSVVLVVNPSPTNSSMQSSARRRLKALQPVRATLHCGSLLRHAESSGSLPSLSDSSKLIFRLWELED
eukprot:1272933-Rhodomonas_salina.2